MFGGINTPRKAGNLAQHLVGLAAAFLRTGRADEALPLLRNALDLLPDRLTEERVHALTLFARAESHRGRHDAALAKLAGPLADPECDNQPGAVDVRLEAARCRLRAGDAATARTWASAAADLADRRSERLAGAAAIGLLVSASSVRHDASVLRAAVDTLDTTGDAALGGSLDAIADIASAELVQERFADARRHFRRGLRLVRRTGDRYAVGELVIGLAQAQAILGDLDGARANAEDAVALADLTTRRDLAATALAVLCTVAGLRGYLDDAVRFGRQACSAGGSMPSAAIAGMTFGAALLDAGDPDGCVEQIERIGGGPALPGVPGLLRPYAYETLARVEVARDRPRQARGWAARARASAVPWLDGHRGIAALAEAETASAGRQTPATLEPARAAVTCFRRAGMPTYQLRALVLAGLAAAELGDYDSAAASLVAAKGLAEHCGADRLYAEVVNAQRRVGASRPRPATSAGELTAREGEVARLVSVGLSNKQIGTTLFLSPRTVEGHLSRVYAKLGVSTRSALIATMLQRGTPSQEGELPPLGS